MRKDASESQQTLCGPVLQIALPLEWASDAASSPSARTKCPSSAATPAAATKGKPRKWYSLCEEAGKALETAQQVLAGLKLRLHPEKTRVAAIDAGFDFLGYHYMRDKRGRLQKVVSRKSRRRFRERIRELTPRHAGQKRPKAKSCKLHRLRRNKRVLAMIEKVSQYLRDWHGYFHGVRTDWPGHWREYDGYVRQRLRNAISGRYAKGRWQRTLSNELFVELGLTTATALHSSLPQEPLKAAPGPGYPGGSRMR